jgi:hypothetical protein
MAPPFRMPTMDAPQAALAFVTTQAAFINTQVNEMVYPEIIYPSVIPVDTSAPPFTQTIITYASDKYGKADWINGNADDIPMAATELNMFKSVVYTAAIGYGFGWEEVNYAMLIGHNIQTADASAARRAYEEMVERICFVGDTTKNMSGLINYPGITAGAPPSGGNWTATTPAANIMADLNSLITGISQGTNYTSYADTILLPPDKLALLAGIIIPDSGGQTFMSWFMRNNAYTLLSGVTPVMKPVRALKTAGAGATNRAVAYRRSPDVLSVSLPMPHRFLPVYQDGPLHWVVPGVFRMGGLQVPRPAEIRYMDGI